MDFTAMLKALNQASGFELYRLRAAIDRVLDEPRWILAIAQRLRPGQRVEYFDPRSNNSHHGQILELRRKQVLVLDEETRQRWLIAYASINLDGADVRIRENATAGLGRHEIAVGDVLGFLDKEGRERSGVVRRLNDKTVSLDVQGQQWRVGYALLHRVMEIDAQEINQAGLLGG